MILDFEIRQTGAHHEADYAIVGAGPAGIILAQELSLVGSVLLIEASSLVMNCHQRRLLKGECVGLPYSLTETRARAFGGSSSIWAGYCAAFDSHDFDERPWVGSDGWPIHAADLEPYYPDAARLLGIGQPSFDAKAIADAAGIEVSGLTEDLRLTAWRFGTPTLRFGDRFANEFANSTSVSTLLNAAVVNIQVDERHERIVNLALGTLDGRSGSATAKTFIFACGGIDTARLLLNSASQIECGVGNDYGHVGRHFMEHPHWDVPNLRAKNCPLMNHSAHRAVDANGRESMFAFGLTPAQQNDAAVLNARAHVYRTPQMAEEEPARVGLFMEQEASELSRVTLSRQVDALGMRRAKLDWRLTELDHYSYRQTRHIVTNSLVQAGLCMESRGPIYDLQPIGSNHQLGTTRMSRMACDGVVDPDCRMHTVENAFIVGGSVFPTVSWANPTFTLMALTYRLASYLRKEHKRSPLPAMER